MHVLQGLFPKSDVAKHLGWRSVGLVDHHYDDLAKIGQPGHTAEVLSSTSCSSSDLPGAISS